MSEYFFFFKWFSSQNKQVKYSRDYLLAFTLFWVITSTDFYSPMKENSQDFMLAHPVSHEQYNPLILVRKKWNKYPIYYVIIPLVNYGFNIKELRRGISENCFITFGIFFCFSSWNQGLKRSRRSMLAYTLFWVVNYAYSYSSMKYK